MIADGHHHRQADRECRDRNGHPPNGAAQIRACELDLDTIPSRVEVREPVARRTGRAIPAAPHRIQRRRPQANRTPAGRPLANGLHTTPQPETALPTQPDSVGAVACAALGRCRSARPRSAPAERLRGPARPRRRLPEAGQPQTPEPRRRRQAVEPWRRTPPRTCSPSTRSAARRPALVPNPSGTPRVHPRSPRLTASPRNIARDRPARRSHGPEHTDLLVPSDHRHRYRVVHEKQPDQ